MRWEEGKKWQSRMERVKNSLRDKERENESLLKQLSTLKDLYGRSVNASCVHSSQHALCLQHG